LRQLPGQLMDDPLAAARWLMSTSAEYGMKGDLLRGLGLFNLTHSPLLHWLLALVGLMLFVHLGDLLGTTWRYTQLASLLSSKATALGEPIPMLPLQPIYRWRQAQAAVPTETSHWLRARLAATFAQVTATTVAWSAVAQSDVTQSDVTQSDVTQSAATQSAATQSAEVTLVDDRPTTTDTAPETRLLATRQQRWVMVQPLLLLGLLLLWYVIWLILTTGWAVTPSALAPGTEYRDAPHELVLDYQIDEQANAVIPRLEARLGKLSQSVTASVKAYMRLGQVELDTTPGPPGLLIRTMAGEAWLNRAGQFNTTSAVGLVFPNPGSEESLVFTQTVVLRIVRLADEPKGANTDAHQGKGAFAVEVYQGNDKQPVQRIQIQEAKTAPFSVNGHTVTLQFAPLPSLEVEVRYLPSAWLTWLALTLILIGALGFWFRPAFLLVQVAPWPEDRSVVIVQSDRQAEAEALRRWVSEAVISHQ